MKVVITWLALLFMASSTAYAFDVAAAKSRSTSAAMRRWLVSRTNSVKAQVCNRSDINAAGRKTDSP